jgi:hypothetical protein
LCALSTGREIDIVFVTVRYQDTYRSVGVGMR